MIKRLFSGGGRPAETAPDDQAPCRFVVLAVPRVGSNYLCSLLNSHPEILCHHELFHPKGIYLAYGYKDGRLDLDGPTRRLSEMPGQADEPTLEYRVPRRRGWVPAGRAATTHRRRRTWQPRPLLMLTYRAGAC